MKVNRKSVLYSALVLSLSGSVLQLLGFSYRILISRLISPEALGVYQLIFPLYGVLMALALSGLGVSSSRVTAERAAVNGGSQVRSVVRTCQIAFIILFVPSAITVLFFRQFIAGTLLGDLRVETAIMVLLPCLFLTGIENIYKSVFHGLRDVHPTIFSEIIELCIRIVSAIGLLLYFHPKSPQNIAAIIVCGMTISEIFSTIFLTIWYRRKIQQAKLPRGKVTRELLGEIARITIPVTISSLTANIILAMITVLIPERLIASGMPRTEAMASFGVLFGMITPLLMLPLMFIGPLATVVLPRLSRSNTLGNMGDVKRKIALSIQVTSLIALPIMAVMIVIGPVLCRLIFGQTGPPSFFALNAVAIIFLYYEILTGAILNAIGRQKRNAVYLVLAGLIEITVTYFTVSNPAIGLYGYALGMLAGGGFACILRFNALHTLLSMQIQTVRWFIVPSLMATAAGCTCSICFFWLKHSGQCDWLSTIFSCICAILVYTFLLISQGIHPLRRIKILYGGNRDEKSFG